MLYYTVTILYTYHIIYFTYMIAPALNTVASCHTWAPCTIIRKRVLVVNRSTRLHLSWFCSTPLYNS